jgi:predicted HicB family RNase H-like nuclease
MKQKALLQVRLYPNTHRKLKIRAAKMGVSIARLIELLAANV